MILVIGGKSYNFLFFAIGDDAVERVSQLILEEKARDYLRESQSNFSEYTQTIKVGDREIVHRFAFYKSELIIQVAETIHGDDITGEVESHPDWLKAKEAIYTQGFTQLQVANNK